MQQLTRLEDQHDSASTEGTVIRVRRRISAEASRVWEVLVDTGAWTCWGPSVADVEHDGAMLRADSTGRIRLPFGPWLGFAVTGFDPGQYFRWSVAGIPATGHRVRRLGPSESELVFEVPVWAAPYALVCKRACEGIARLAES